MICHTFNLSPITSKLRSTTERMPDRICQLPNGMEIAYQSSAEIEFFYKDIFEKQIYVQHGVQLSDGDCVFDVGANVGFFTLFAHQQANGLKIYAFEPAPPL